MSEDGGGICKSAESDRNRNTTLGEIEKQEDAAVGRIFLQDKLSADDKL